MKRAIIISTKRFWFDSGIANNDIETRHKVNYSETHSLVLIRESLKTPFILRKFLWSGLVTSNGVHGHGTVLMRAPQLRAPTWSLPVDVSAFSFKAVPRFRSHLCNVTFLFTIFHSLRPTTNQARCAISVNVALSVAIPIWGDPNWIINSVLTHVFQLRRVATGSAIEGRYGSLSPLESRK